MQKNDGTEAGQVPRFSMNDAVGNLFQTAVLLLGEEQTAALVVEQVVAETGIDPCTDLDLQARELTDQIIAASLVRVREQTPGALDAPSQDDNQGGSAGGCIQSDDLSATGISPEELQEMVDGAGSAKLRQWLEQLSPCLRVVFVLRAMLSQDNEAAASTLMQSGARGWGADQVSLIYRQALCSLATSLVNSTHTHLVF